MSLPSSATSDGERGPSRSVVLLEAALALGSEHELEPVLQRIVESAAKVADAPETRPARPQGPGGALSERELEVLRLVARGLTNAQIAERLVVSIRTVETHRAHIQHKLGVSSRAELFGFAQEHGLLDQGDAAP